MSVVRLHMRRIFELTLLSLLVIPIALGAQSDVWHELFSIMRFADVNRARIELDCKENPQFLSVVRLNELCKKLHLIPDHVIEDAALPYLQKHLTEKVAREAITQWGSALASNITDKIIREISSGKSDQLNQSELTELQRLNNSDVGLALSSFATDKEQGLAVAHAMMGYMP